VKAERMTRISAAPRMRSWIRLFYVPLIWIMTLSGVFIGPTVRVYSTADYVMWISVAVIFPVAILLVLVSRYRRVYTHARRAANDRFWVFADGILVPPPSSDRDRPKARRLGQGWLTLSRGHVLVVENGGSAVDRRPVLSGETECVSLVRLMRPFFEPVTRIVFADGTRLDVNLVKPGFKDIVGYRMKDYIDFERSLT
jgi:hypothetical protein